MNTFILKDVNSDTTLALTGNVPHGLVDYEGYDFVASLTGRQLSASVTVYDIHPAGWINFFADIAQNWQGWDGAKEIASLEGHLKLSVTSDSLGHIKVCITLGCVDTGGDWKAQNSMYLEAGQLDAIAMEAKRFFG